MSNEMLLAEEYISSFTAKKDGNVANAIQTKKLIILTKELISSRIYLRIGRFSDLILKKK